MNGQRMDRIARALASGMSRRSAMKALAVGLGLAGAVAPRLTRAAKWDLCHYHTDASCTAFVFDLCVRDGCRDIALQGVVYTASACDPILDLSKKECHALLLP